MGKKDKSVIGKSLTIGIIARNGLPFLNDCLSSLPQSLDEIERLEVILVDCISTDETLKVMKEFSSLRSHVQVFSIEGRANAAVARNVILDHTTSQFLMLLDGDTILSPPFLTVGIKTIESGMAEAVIGNMEEQRFGRDNKPEGEVFWRCRITKKEYVRTTHRCTGSILLGPKILEKKFRYDEIFRRGQDRDFALCISETLRILHLPEKMGRHLTHYYFSESRLMEFYRSAYPRPIGLLLRKHGRYIDRLRHILIEEKGVFLGFFYQILLATGLILFNKWIVGLILTIVGLDFLRFLTKGEVSRFIALRFFSPLLVVQGFFGIGEGYPRYSVKQII